MNNSLESILALLVNLTHLLTFFWTQVRSFVELARSSNVLQPRKFYWFTSRHWEILCAVCAWGVTIVTGYFSQRPVNVVVIIMLLCLIVVPHIHGSRIWRRNSESIVAELVQHLAKTLTGYIALMIGACFVALVLNPSVDNLQSISTLPEHVLSLFVPLLIWAAMAGVVSPLIWENVRHDLETIYLRTSNSRLGMQ